MGGFLLALRLGRDPRNQRVRRPYFSLLNYYNYLYRPYNNPKMVSGELFNLIIMVSDNKLFTQIEFYNNGRIVDNAGS